MHERIRPFPELVHNLYTAFYKNAAFFARTHTQTHTLDYRWLKNLWKSDLRRLLDLLLLSVEFHVLEANELSHFLSIGKRQESHAFWYRYNLFHDQKLLHCKGDVTSRMYMERYQNIAQYLEDYRPNGISTDFQKYPINTAIHCPCYRHKDAQIAQNHAPIDFCFQI